MGPAGAAEPEDSDRYRVIQAKEREHQRKVEAKTKQAYQRIMAMHGARTVHRPLQRPPREE